MSDRLFLLTQLDGLVSASDPARDLTRRLLSETCLPSLPGLHVSSLEGGVLVTGDGLNVQVAEDGGATAVRWIETRDVREVAEFLGLVPQPESYSKAT